MLWVIQNNLYSEDGYVRFIEALDRFNSNYIVVKPVPFTNKLLKEDFDSTKENFETTEEPEIDPNQPIVVMGTISLTRIAKAKGWTPGSFHNNNFDFEVWRDGYGVENVLNPDSVVTKISDSFDISHLSDHVFVRPVHDTKAFTGVVMSKYDFDDWYKQIRIIPETEFQPLHQNTEITIADAKKINAEYRMFIVDGRVVTGSLYKRGVNNIHSDQVDTRIYEFTQFMVDRWQRQYDKKMRQMPPKYNSCRRICFRCRRYRSWFKSS